MSWRKILKNNISDPLMQKVQNIQKAPKKTFAPSAPFAGDAENIKKSCWTCSYLSFGGLPGLCSWYPESKPIPVSIVDNGCKQFKATSVNINHLWKHAHKMADFTDGGNAPFEERKALVPAIFSIGNRIDEIKGE